MLTPRLESYQKFVPLLLRLGVGLTFFFAGLGKITGGIGGVSKFFAGLSIPLPGVMAPFIAYLELLGGLALILGVLTQLFSILFICDMLVAILVAKLPLATKAADMSESWTQIRVELLLLLGAASLVILGAGMLSIDETVLRNRAGRTAPVSSTAR